MKSSQTFVWSCTAQSFLSRLLLWTDAVILSVFNSADICAAAAQVPGPGPDWWRHSAFTRTQSSNISSVQPPALPGFCWQTFYTLVICSILLRLWMQPKIAPNQKRSCFHLLAPSSRSCGDQSASCHCLNLKAYFKSKHKQVKMMTVRKFPERPMLITKAINFHLMREQISNCLPLESLNFPLPRFSRKMSFLSEKCSLISSPSSTGGGSGYLMGK